jgi:hypothetical protein
MRLVSDNEGNAISKVCHVWEVEGTYLHNSLSECLGSNGWMCTMQ